MKIITDFKDYYDHIAFQYGGGDPKIVYLRPHKKNQDSFNLEKSHFDGHTRRVVSINKLNIKCESITNAYNLYMHHFDSRKEFIPEVKGIVIGDIFFCQIKMKKDENFRFINQDDLYEKYSIPWLNGFKLSSFINYKDSSLIELCRKVNTPVFTFNINRNYIYIDENCPNLGKIGIAKYINDNDMYQHLSYFIGNVIKISPDMMPQISVTDKVKIEGHGFDYKTSFRGKLDGKKSSKSFKR